MPSIVLVQMEITSMSRRYPPLGLLYVANALEQAGHSITIFHERGTKFNRKKLLRIIERERPLFCGFSTTTGPQLLPTLLASMDVKKRFGIPIVWGGVHPTILPRQVLKESCVDIVVIGEGEETAVELADTLAKNEDIRDVKGIAYKENGTIRVNPGRPFIRDLDRFDLSWHLVKIERYLQRREKWGSERVLPIITSRGCPHRCGFCYNFAVNKRQWRGHSAKKVSSNIKELRNKAKIDGFIFCDDNFFVNIPRALEIVKEKCCWGADIRVDCISDDLARELTKTNCKQLYVGIESGCNRILRDIVHKDITVQQIKDAVLLCKQYNIPLFLSFIIGFPGECHKEMMKTILMARRLQELYPGQILLINRYIPYPGTPLWGLSLKYGFKPPKNIKGWADLTMTGYAVPWIEQGVLNIIDIFNIAYSVRVPILSSSCRRRIKEMKFSGPWEVRLFKVSVKLFDVLKRFYFELMSAISYYSS